MTLQRKTRFATEKDFWETPQWLFDLLDQEFHFDCDAAATPENTKVHGQFFALWAGNGALDIKDWDLHMGFQSFFLNPPYSAGNIDRFMAKALEESQKGAVVVCLVPCATDTKWWHNYAMKAQEIRFIKGRVKFVGYDEERKQIKNSPTFSSCVVIFDKTRGILEGLNQRLPDFNPTPKIGKTIEQPRSVKA